MVGVEHRTGGRDVCTVLGALVPRQLEDRVEPGADPAGLRGLLAGALELVDLAQRGLADRLGQVGRLDPGAVVVRAVGLALAELLADGGELLAEQELALVLLQALADVLADLVVDLVLGVVGPRPLDEQAQPVAHVGGLQHLALLVVGEVRRVAGGVGERVGVGEASYGLDHLPRLAALQDRDDEGAVVLGERAELVGDDRLGHGLGLDPEGRTGSGHAGADGDAALGAQHRGGPAAGEAADPVDHGHHAVGGVAVLEPRGDEDAGGLVVRLRDGGRVVGEPGGVDGRAGLVVELDGHDHAGEHDRVVEEHHREGDGKRNVLRHALSTRGIAGSMPGRVSPTANGRRPL